MPKTNTSSGSFATTLLVAIVTLAVAGSGGYMLGSRAAQPENQTIATVNGTTINKTALYERMLKQTGAQTVDRMIEEELINQAAEKAGVTVSDADIDAEIDKIRDQIGGQDKLLEAMSQYGITIEQLREDQTNRLKMVKILGKDLPTDDATLQKYYDENLGQFDKREVHSRHILVNTEDEAKAIKGRLDQGADFATMAKEFSIEPGADQSGGDLGSNRRGAMVAEFDKVVFAMTPKEVSAPFQSQFGWHIAQVLEVTGEAPVFEALKDQVKDAYLNQSVQDKMQSWLDELRTSAKITNTLEK